MKPRKPRIRIKHQLPSRFGSAPGLVAHGDVPVNRGRLRAKVLVFRTPTALQSFWKIRLLKGSLGRGCLGAVNSLGYYVSKFGRAGETRTIEADRRYFCVIGLVVGHLTMRVISHESVHAAYAFAKRRSRSWWDEQSRRNDEEELAYPTGEIASGIVNLLLRKKLLDAGSSTEPKRRTERH